MQLADRVQEMAVEAEMADAATANATKVKVLEDMTGFLSQNFLLDHFPS